MDRETHDRIAKDSTQYINKILDELKNDKMTVEDAVISGASTYYSLIVKIMIAYEGEDSNSAGMKLVKGLTTPHS